MINVVDLMRLQPESEHPHGMSDREFDQLFTTDRPIIFNYHGYPWLIHRLTYRRTGHPHLHVRGYKEEGTTTTPFDMAMMNDIDRFHLVMDVIGSVGWKPEVRSPTEVNRDGNTLGQAGDIRPQTRSNSRRSIGGGGPATTSASARSTCSTTRSCASR